eukprot:GEMP01094883.1.p2 GENE.GEMP01094883.1~~GEMP01094883.1.p2  ORF type:complete len:160 (-),score=23.59 GEMP01094883.1:23-502(-)
MSRLQLGVVIHMTTHSCSRTGAVERSNVPVYGKGYPAQSKDMPGFPTHFLFLRLWRLFRLCLLVHLQDAFLLHFLLRKPAHAEVVVVAVVVVVAAVDVVVNEVVVVDEIVIVDEVVVDVVVVVVGVNSASVVATAKKSSANIYTIFIWNRVRAFWGLEQ